MNKTEKKILGVALGAGLVLGGLGGAFLFPTTNTITDQVEVINEVEKIVEVPVETIVTETIEVEKIVEVEVDNGNLDTVLDHIYDTEGNVEYLLKGLDDDEVNQIVDRVVFINDVTTLAVKEVKAEFMDLIDKEDFGGVEKFFDEDNIGRVRIQDKDGDIVCFDVDFKDGDAEVEVEVKFEQDDIKYKVKVIVEFRDGKVDDIDLGLVELRA